MVCGAGYGFNGQRIRLPLKVNPALVRSLQGFRAFRKMERTGVKDIVRPLLAVFLLLRPKPRSWSTKRVASAAMVIRLINAFVKIVHLSVSRVMSRILDHKL